MARWDRRFFTRICRRCLKREVFFTKQPEYREDMSVLALSLLLLCLGAAAFPLICLQSNNLNVSQHFEIQKPDAN